VPVEAARRIARAGSEFSCAVANGVRESPSMASVRRRGNGRTGLSIISEVDAGYPGVVSVRRRVSFPRTVTAQAGVLRDVARRGLRPVAASKVVA
jgi:hypothetical protein